MAATQLRSSTTCWVFFGASSDDLTIVPPATTPHLTRCQTPVALARACFLGKEQITVLIAFEKIFPILIQRRGLL